MNDTITSSEVPLTSLQKARLLVECLPLLFFSVVFVLCITLIKNITGTPVPPLVLLFLGFVILVVGWTAVQRTRDLLSGVALVREDVLERAYRSGGSTRNPFRGRFAQLGTVRLTRGAYSQVSSVGPPNRCRIFYSPASKIVWSLERLG